MARGIIFVVFIIAVYYFIKTVTRSAVKAYHEEKQRGRLDGDEMVLDPECHTYILKDRAVTRSLDGKRSFFCSEACARRYERKSRS
jgi:YHS domain-containing protein